MPVVAARGDQNPLRTAQAESAAVQQKLEEVQKQLAEVMRKRNAADRENKELRAKVEEFETKRNDMSKEPIKAKRTFSRVAHLRENCNLPVTERAPACVH